MQDTWATCVKGVAARAVETEKRVVALAPEADVFFQAVSVFTSAWVKARFGTVLCADCGRDAGLRTHLLDEKGRRKLSRTEVEGVGEV